MAHRSRRPRSRTTRRSVVDSGNTWTAATSAPGEIYTPEGRIRAAGAFVRGLRNAARHPLRNEALYPFPRFVAISAGIVVLAWLYEAYIR
jgi:hypothetical protein